eukprot:scpid78776/ scgid6355/ Ceramide synthase 1; LAG1 longevity assurance homolog 1; Longevity assurance gene 1 protein homolog 1; Protein UOG-1
MERVPTSTKALEPKDWPPFDPHPSSYVEIIPCIYSSIAKGFSRWMEARGSVLEYAQQDWKQCSSVVQEDVWAVLLVAVLFTLLRSQLTIWVFKPFASWLQLRKLDCQKFPESMFKVAYYTIAFSLGAYILFGMGDDYFGNQAYPFQGWYANMPINNVVYGLYIMQLGFYVHAVYGVLVLDARRKDTFIMVIHHIITLLLIGFSFAVRFHRIGVVVMFLHDNADICLEAGKLTMMARHRGKKFDQIMDHVSTFCFVMFMLSWFLLRLVIYVRAVLYSTAYVAPLLIEAGPFWLGFNCLLIILYFMNVWWFQFILLAAVRILTGSTLNDTREDTSDDETDDTTQEGNTVATRADRLSEDDQSAHAQMRLQKLLNMPENKAPSDAVSPKGVTTATEDVHELAPGQSASQTTNRRLRSRQS